MEEEHITISSPLPYSAQRRGWKRLHERHNARQRQEQDADGPSWLRWFVHLLGIGNGNPTEEIRWTQRIRRFSIASVLLFLVWVGTRIPRR